MAVYLQGCVLKRVVTQGTGQPALEFIDEAPVLTAPYAQETNLTSPAATATPAATPIVHLTSTSPVSPFQTPESGSGSGSWEGKQSPGLQDATNVSLVSLFRPNRPDPPWTTLFGGETVYLQLSQEETCVLRYFVEEMAKWVYTKTHCLSGENRRLTQVV